MRIGVAGPERPRRKISAGSDFMSKKILAVMALAIMASFVPARVSAQGAPAGQGPAQAGGPPPAPPQTMDLVTAKKMIVAAEAAATAANAHAAICVLDSN